MISVKQYNDKQLLDFMEDYCVMSDDAFSIMVDSRMILLCMERLNYSLDAYTVFYYAFYDLLYDKDDESILEDANDDCKPAMKELLKIAKEKNEKYDFLQLHFDKFE